MQFRQSGSNVVCVDMKPNGENSKNAAILSAMCTTRVIRIIMCEGRHGNYFYVECRMSGANKSAMVIGVKQKLATHATGLNDHAVQKSERIYFSIS